jgi:hypothetical protein
LINKSLTKKILWLNKKSYLCVIKLNVMAEFNEQDLIVDRLSDYAAENIKVIDQWDDRSGSPCQGGANNATIELPTEQL